MSVWLSGEIWEIERSPYDPVTHLDQPVEFFELPFVCENKPYRIGVCKEFESIIFGHTGNDSTVDKAIAV
jgi:hypothetical protein